MRLLQWHFRFDRRSIHRRADGTLAVRIDNGGDGGSRCGAWDRMERPTTEDEAFTLAINWGFPVEEIEAALSLPAPAGDESEPVRPLQCGFGGPLVPSRRVVAFDDRLLS